MSRARRFLLMPAFICVAAAAATSLAACSSNPASSNAVSSTFVYDENINDIGTEWDPATTYDTEIVATANIYETLTYYNSQTKTLEPDLATKWSSADGGTSWTFELRHGVKFHTGRLMTSEAVKSAIERTIAVNQGAAYEWGPVTSILTPSEYTVTFKTKYAYPLSLVTSSAYGAYIYDTKAAGSGNLASWFKAGHDAGTGPYTVKSFTPGQETMLVLKAFPQYWGGWSGNHFKEIAFRYTPESSTAASLLRSQQVTYVQSLSPQIWSTFDGQRGFQTTTSLSWQNYLLDFNTQSGPFANADFRKAVSYAIDYNGIIKALAGAAIRTPGIVTPGLLGYSSALPEYSYDLAKAKQYLQESGLASSHPTVTICIVNGETFEATPADLIKSELSPLGITVNIKTVDVGEQLALADSTNPVDRPDMAIFTWWPDYADAYSWFVNIFTKQNPPVWNWSGYSDTALESQINSAESVLAKSASRGAALYEQMQREIYNDDATMSLFDIKYERVLLAGIKGYVDNPGYPNVVFVYRITP